MRLNINYLIIFFLVLINIYFFGKIEELRISSDNGYYKKVKNQKVFIAEGNAHIFIDDNEIYCNEMEIFLTEDENVEKAVFRKNIIIFQEKDKIHIGGEFAEYFKKEKNFVIYENAFYKTNTMIY